MHITAVRDSQAVHVTVADDSVGLGEGLRPVIGQGVGLSNIRSQLALRYGEQGQLAVSSRVSGGTFASITVPSNTGRARTNQ